jgi:hypothetical protein
MNICKEPTCVYSQSKKKCIKPNPYIQFISQCKRKDKTLDECKIMYKDNIDKIKKNSCRIYEENLKHKISNSSCPKNRRPINDICPEEFKILKNNKYNIPCCYKEKPPRILKSASPDVNKSLNKSSSKLFKETSNKFLNKMTGKLVDVKRYTKKLKANKV